jgi:hypothetical protein
MFLSNIIVKSDFSEVRVDKEVRLHHVHERAREKNWCPFVYRSVSGEEQLYLVYSILPHHILAIDTEAWNRAKSGGVLETSTVASTEPSNMGIFPWNRSNFGEPRGGTPAILIATSYGPRYISFFHSVQAYHDGQDEKKGHGHSPLTKTYLMGAYLFFSDPPFAISHFSPEPIVPRALYTGSQNSYTPRHSLKIDYCAFPMNVWEERNDTLSISLGHNDRHGFIMYLDKLAFLSTLKPVSNYSES